MKMWQLLPRKKHMGQTEAVVENSKRLSFSYFEMLLITRFLDIFSGRCAGLNS